MFGIPKRVTLLCIPTLSEILSLFLGGDVSDSWIYSEHDGFLEAVSLFKKRQGSLEMTFLLRVYWRALIGN